MEIRPSENLTDKIIGHINLFFFKYRIAMIALFILSLVGQAAIQIMLYRLKSDGTLINVAGRQRMLAQKITKDLVLISHSYEFNPGRIKELSNSKREWEDTHHQIGHSSDLGDIDFKKNDPKFTKLYASIDKSLRSVLEWNFHEDRMEKLLFHERNFATKMNELVYYLVEVTNKKVLFLRFFEIMIFLLTFSLLWFEFVFLYSKTRRNFSIFVDKYEIKSHLTRFFLNSDNHFFCLLSENGNLLDSNNAWKSLKIMSKSINENALDILGIQKLPVDNSSHTSRVVTANNNYKMIQWNIKKVRGDSKYYVCGFNITEEHIARENLLHQNKMQILGEAAAELAHEVKNPLTFIKGNLDYLNKLEAFNTIEKKDSYSSIRYGINRLNEIVENFRITRSGVQTNVNDSKEHCTNLKKTIESSLKMFRLAHGSSININCKVPTTLNVNIKEGQLLQCLSNILKNSAENFTRIEGKKLINISSTSSSEFIILDICDNGGGPTDLKIDEIFKPFSSMGKKGENNSGLGLYITKNILEKNGGEISASVKNNQFKIKIKMKISKIAPAHTPFQTLS